MRGVGMVLGLVRDSATLYNILIWMERGRSRKSKVESRERDSVFGIWD